MRRLMLILLVLGVTACGDDSGGDPIDAAGAGTDAAAAETPCPPTDDLMCDTATQMCVVAGPFGPTDQSSCQAVPAGCESDRTCSCAAATLCPNVQDTCSEPAANTIYCDNGTQ